MDDDNPSDWSSNVSDVEIDVLLLYFTFSDQYGRVDIIEAANYAARKLGYIINRDPFTIEQKHLDILMDKQIVPDVRVIFNKILNDPTLNGDGGEDCK